MVIIVFNVYNKYLAKINNWVLLSIDQPFTPYMHGIYVYQNQFIMHS